MDDDMLVNDRVEGVASPYSGPSGTSGARHRPLLLIDDDGLGDSLQPLIAAAGLRLAASVPSAEATAHLGDTILVDIVWLTRSEAIGDDGLAELAAAIAGYEAALLCETSLADLDRVAAAFAGLPQVQLMVAPTALDRQLALAAAGAPRLARVHDLTHNPASEQIERLQEEVARISRAVAELASRSADAAAAGPAYSLRPDSFAGYPADVRAPGRDFRAAPRSFIPEERLAPQRTLARSVRAMLRRRRLREQFFPADLFADPAWDMLLDLYAARLEGRAVSVSSLCIAAAVPATTALRWIKTMTEADLFVREADPQDGRRIFIALSAQSVAAMDSYFAALEE